MTVDDSMRRVIAEQHDEIAALRRENDELREMVRDMFKALMHDNCYLLCEFKEPCNYVGDGRCQWHDRMRALGIETS